MEGDYHGQRRSAWFLGKGSVKRPDIQCPLSAVGGRGEERERERESLLAALLSTGCFNTGKKTQVAVEM